MGYLSPPPAPAPVIVYKDVGGLVSDYEARTAAYRQENREVRLHECRSACTMALSLPNVCVYPDSRIKFHQAYNANTRETDYGVSATLFNYYPPAVQARLGHLTRDYRVLSGIELISMGVRNCNGPDRVLVASRKAPKPVAVPDALDDVARKVRIAVASAFEGDKGAPGAPIRIAVVDRKPGAAPPPPARERIAYGAASPVDPAPTPPKRPPSLAFSPRDDVLAPARLQPIPGSQPILDATQFKPRTVAAR